MHLVTTLDTYKRYQMKDLITNYWNKARGKGPIQTYWRNKHQQKMMLNYVISNTNVRKGTLKTTTEFSTKFSTVLIPIEPTGKLLNVKLNRFDCSIH